MRTEGEIGVIMKSERGMLNTMTGNETEVITMIGSEIMAAKAAVVEMNMKKSDAVSQKLRGGMIVATESAVLLSMTAALVEVAVDRRLPRRRLMPVEAIGMTSLRLADFGWAACRRM
jgi:hypothetical protein